MIAKQLSVSFTDAELLVFCSTMFGASQTASGSNKVLYDKLFRKSYALLEKSDKIVFRKQMEVLVASGMFGAMKAFVSNLLDGLE